jgi:lipoprotein NlpD
LPWFALAVLAGCAGTRISAPILERPHAASDKAAGKPLPAVAAGHYRVQPGDTLYKIAFEHGLDSLDLAAWNNLSDPDHILSGEILRVVPPKPTPVAYPQPEAAPTVTTRALPAEPTVAARALPVLAPARTVAAPARPGVAFQPSAADDAPPDTWSWPVRGTILARFGDGLNKGIDIAAPSGTTVQAAAPGRVVYAGSGLRGYGKLIIIRHGKSLLSAYAHNARILVKEGQNVTRGQAVGEIGDSDADRVELHFEIREFGKPVDPMNYLPNAG